MDPPSMNEDRTHIDLNFYQPIYNNVEYNSEDDTYHLIQKKYTLQELEIFYKK